MDKKSFIARMLEAFESLNSTLNIGVLEVLVKADETYASFFRKELIHDEKFLSLDSIVSESSFMETPDQKVHDLKLNSETGIEIFCKIYPLPFNEKIAGFVIFQSGEEIDSVNYSIFEFLAKVIGLFVEYTSFEVETIRDSEKYKNELINMRDIQAKLFPKFEEVESMDISSAYLPSDFMTGNFIDGTFLDKNNYQVAVCEVKGSYATSSFVGAAIRTLLHSEESLKTTPSVLIERISSKLKSIISGIHSLVNISIYQINVNTGRVTFSSLGSMTTVFYNMKRKGHVNLKDTSVGKLLEKQNFYKDISLSLEGGDALLFYSQGILSTTTEDGSMSYGEGRLIENFRENVHEDATGVVHSIIESVYELANYSPISEDIMLICMKRK